jgi:hypothetical protein
VAQEGDTSLCVGKLILLASLSSAETDFHRQTVLILQQNREVTQ